MRDLTRANNKRPGWKRLSEAGYRTYTPMTWKVRRACGGRTTRLLIPVIHDLLFVESTREELDPFVEQEPMIQYRYVRGGSYREAMEVSSEEMERFMRATSDADKTLYYRPEEITPQMIGKEIRVIGGPLNGMTGRLLSIKGMRKKRLIVEISGMLTAAVEVEKDFIAIENKN